jgi:hypothetical protein
LTGFIGSDGANSSGLAAAAALPLCDPPSCTAWELNAPFWIGDTAAAAALDDAAAAAEEAPAAAAGYPHPVGVAGAGKSKLNPLRDVGNDAAAAAADPPAAAAVCGAAAANITGLPSSSTRDMTNDRDTEEWSTASAGKSGMGRDRSSNRKIENGRHSATCMSTIRLHKALVR